MVLRRSPSRAPSPYAFRAHPRNPQPTKFRRFFQVPYPLTPVFSHSSENHRGGGYSSLPCLPRASRGARRRSHSGTHYPPLATSHCFQSLPTIKVCNHFVLITIRIAGDGYSPLPARHLKFYFSSARRQFAQRTRRFLRGGCLRVRIKPLKWRNLIANSVPQVCATTWLGEARFVAAQR